jgi:hypothetical protein
MDEFWPCTPRAVEVAETLTSQNGDSALGIAREIRLSAIAAGRSGRADLYQAVCTILIDRDQVFSRWKAQRPWTGLAE